ncbi:hypothetical protein PIB30_009065 [Stylosanthes scabra]|uniref:rRNA methyltransferase 1, mitochondrial n=1 Tax=Stylosanthes scabra TaxID=79078 RepID=A0ABU6V3D1_9FABA|nr:hypothetical protein [Stylosanthes scabra]
MYTNLSKAHAFPLAAKFSSQPRCLNSPLPLKPQSFSHHYHKKPSKNPSFKNVVNPRGLMLKFATRYCKARSFSSSHVRKLDAGTSSSSRDSGKQLPWLVASEAKVLERAKPNKISSSIQEGSEKKVNTKSSWEQSVERLEKRVIHEHEGFSKPAPSAASKERKSGLAEKIRVQRTERSDYGSRYVKSDNHDDDEVGDDEIDEAIDDPRWDNIKNRYRGMGGAKVGSERPEFRRWNKQENWGKKTWKEATESTMPKIVGEGIYGVGPVLAALSAERREFYALYVQEGLDLSSNNRKKKDKKGFEKVLRIAEKVGLTIKEASKHDLNMVADNRPHQGLVLDASPLEMVKIMQLDPVSVDEGKGSLWVALDEVTDPQNLGAIIRSSYFFGASGIVLCAKNSAPLSGVVSKASAGSLELMELRYCKNMMQFLVSSAENGWRVLGGSVSSRAISLDEVEPGPPTILVLGSEGTGLRPLVERSCTQLVRIPGNIPSDLDNSESNDVNRESSGKEFLSFLAVESLNVSVAAGVLLHHLIGKNSAGSLLDGYTQTDSSE